MTLEQFIADQRTVQAVAYCFIIIGEASGQLLSEVTERYAQSFSARVSVDEPKSTLGHGYLQLAAAFAYARAYPG